MKKLILIILLLTGYLPMYAQQTPVFAQYFINPFVLNPAVAGDGYYTRAFFSYRKQWVGITGAPESQMFAIDGSLKNENIGLGLIFYNDVTNIIGRTSAMASSSYTAKFGELHRLSFGLSLGILQNKIFFDRVQSNDLNDDVILNNVDNRSALDGNFGINYRIKGFSAGLISQQLFENTINHENAADFKTLSFTLIRHYVATMRYDFRVADKFVVSPIVLARTATGLNSQYDFTALVKYNDNLWLSSSYRNGIGINMAFGAEVNRKFSFSYAYEIPTTRINNFSTGSHEFSMQFRFGKGSPAAADGQADIEQYENSLNDIKDDIVEVKDLEKRVNRNEELIYSDRVDIKKIRQAIEQYKEEFAKIKEKDNIKLDIEYNATLDTDTWDYYVVIGTFKELETAKTYQRLIRRNSEVNTAIIMNNKETVYFVTAGKVTSKRKGIEMLKYIKEGPAKPYLNNNPWVYKRRK